MDETIEINPDLTVVLQRTSYNFSDVLFDNGGIQSLIDSFFFVLLGLWNLTTSILTHTWHQSYTKSTHKVHP